MLLFKNILLLNVYKIADFVVAYAVCMRHQ